MRGVYLRTETLDLKKGAKIYGGFDGSETSTASRDTRIDGFTITGGTGTHYNGGYYGGGMYNGSSSPNVTNCVFINNNSLAGNGGGMANINSSPTITNCIFSGNFTNSGGGGMANSYSNPIITNCTFHKNEGDSNGGGMRNFCSSPTLINCTFCANRAICDVEGSSKMGVGMSNHESDPIIINSIFWDSDTSEIYSETSSDITIRNCVVKDMWVENKGDDGCSTASSDITSADPYFGLFAENGGPVQTIQISAGGSACRAGLAPGTVVKPGVYVPSTDARGVSRDIGVSADIGAYVWQYGSGKVTVLAASTDLELGQTTTVTISSDIRPLSSDTDANALLAVTLTAVSPDIAALSSDNKTITALSRGTAKFNAIIR